jgi:hypothetical protein
MTATPHGRDCDYCRNLVSHSCKTLTDANDCPVLTLKRQRAAYAGLKCRHDVMTAHPDASVTCDECGALLRPPVKQ